jgi:hypothetical protein
MAKQQKEKKVVARMWVIDQYGHKKLYTFEGFKALLKKRAPREVRS